jgi:DNA repair exonuclease SbcCD ATPase subunit
MTVRMIVVWRLSTGQKTALYTNDKTSPMEKLAEPMTRRWSEQENIFQKMMRRYNLNYHPGYYIDELANQPVVANPKIKSVKEEIKELEYRLAQHKQQLATRLLNLKNKSVSIEAYEKRQRKTLPKLQALEQQLASLQQQLQALPEQVSIIEALAGGKLSACDLEKKKIYDVIQIVAYNAEQMLLEIFQKYYHDQRDIEQILDMLINYGGYVKLYNNTLYVIINYIDQPTYRRAARELCQELNALAPTTLDAFQFPIFFKIGEHAYPVPAR